MRERSRQAHRGRLLLGKFGMGLSMLVCIGLLACSSEKPSGAPGAPERKSSQDRAHGAHGAVPGQPGGPALMPGGPMSPHAGLHRPARVIPGDPSRLVDPPAGNDWTTPQAVAERPAGGRRPQIAVDGNGGRHLVYYRKKEDADVVVYRFGDAGKDFRVEEVVSQTDDRNLGPDLVISSDGQPWVCYDQAREDSTGQVYLTHRTEEGWAPLEQVSEATGVETSSSHLAFDKGNRATVVWISREPKIAGWSEVLSRVRREDGEWGPIQKLYQGEQDAFHSNIMRSPSGAQVMGFDLMARSDYRQVRVAIVRDGTWSVFQPVGDADLSTFRPNFGFGVDGQLFAAWTDAHQNDLLGIGMSYVTGHVDAPDGDWSTPIRLSRGFVGHHYDPDVARSANGDVMMVWTWLDKGRSAVLYSRWRQGRFDPPQRLSLHQQKAMLPSIAADPDDRFHVVWNTGDQAGADVMYAVTQ